MLQEYVSKATLRNWDKLGTNSANKLLSRANKIHSIKKFIPIERCTSEKTESLIGLIMNKVETNHWDIGDVMYSVVMFLFRYYGIEKKKSYEAYLKEYCQYKVIDDIFGLEIPLQEYDLLGTIYQSLLTEGEKNKNGSYYTEKDIVEDMVKDIDLSHGKIFLDPCCGSGAFLLSLKNAEPTCLYGVDTDEIAVMLAKANLMIRYLEYDFVPNIFVGNFLDGNLCCGEVGHIKGKVDFIATNPPWGAVCGNYHIEGIVSGETATSFFVEAYSYLARNGCMNFLLPVSVLNVKTHKDFRSFALSKGCLERIQIYEKLFTGVTTKYTSILFSNKEVNSTVTYCLCRGGNKTEKTVSVEWIKSTENLAFNFVNDVDEKIICKLKGKGCLNLKDSQWALGIVTGNNKGKLQIRQTKTNEPIYTGKEIKVYVLDRPKYYVDYIRESFQQVAKDEFYRAREKLVYKFISRKLVFAYDQSGALFLNSANILIPKIEGMSVKTVMAFLNSVFFQYLYIKLFDEVKILKGNLLKLPFPIINKNDDITLSMMVDKILQGEFGVQKDIENWMQKFYVLSDKELEHIREVVNGKVA